MIPTPPQFFAASGQYEREKAQGTKPPFPTLTDAFMRMVETAWDAEVARAPPTARTPRSWCISMSTNAPAGSTPAPALSDADRQYLLCDADCEIWLEQRGQVIGTGRSTRVISRRLRRALEYRNNTCAVPGCGATRGLHAHHIQHWEDGGVTELHNLVLVCPHHHRMHHRGEITIRAPADQLVVCDRDGDPPITNASLARPPTQPPPPAVPPWHGPPLGQRAEWWWYEPYKPSPN